MSMFDGIMSGVSSFFGGNPGGAAVGIGAGLLGGLFGSSETSDLNKNMEQFMDKERSTAYQVASKDMTAAGLNPAMMFGSGSAAPIPGVQFQNPAKVGLDALQGAAATATQMRVADATVNNLVQQNANLKASAGLTAADTVLRGQQTATEKWRTLTGMAESGTAGLNQEITRNIARTSSNQLGMDPTVRRLLDIAGFGGKSLSQILAPVSGTASLLSKFF